jgi:predicted nucleotidyltransferase component of viral defense system
MVVVREFAARPAKERAEAFEETAAQMNISRAAIVEKDFWVCWTLSALFGEGGPSDLATHSVPTLLFKGGTSLSKVYGLLDRFSEDVDLTVDRAMLITEEEHPEARGISNREQKRRIERLEARCVDHVRDVLVLN